MAWSAPNDLARSHFAFEPAVAMTVAPSALATCTEASPTAPAAAWMTMVSPSRNKVASVRATAAVVKDTGIAAASVKRVDAGTGNAMSARTIANSAKPPQSTFAMTSSPSRFSEPGPTATTLPDTSWPGVKGRGGRTWYLSSTIRRSEKFIAAPCTCMRSSLSSTVGTGRVDNSRCSRPGPAPDTQACIDVGSGKSPPQTGE